MKCHICDATLGDSEIKYNKDCQEYDPCGYCLQIISEVFDDHLTEDEIDQLIAFEFGDDDLSPDANSA